MSYRHIAVRPLAGTIGAEIDGVALARPVDDETFAEIRRAFLDHLVIFFAGQRLTPEQHKGVTCRFGPLSCVPYVRPLDEHPEIIAVLKEAEERKISVFGGAWHS